MIQTDPAEILKNLKQKGYAAFRRPGAQIVDFLALTDTLSTGFTESRPSEPSLTGGNSGRHTVAGVHSLFIETGREQLHEVPLHGELYFHHLRPPKYLWAYCSLAGSEPGELLLCDGVTLYAALPAAIQSLLAREPVMYLRRHERSVWQALYQTDQIERVEAFLKSEGIEMSLIENGGIETRFLSSALRTVDGAPAFVNNILPFGLRQLREPHKTQARICLANGELFPEGMLREIWARAQQLSFSWTWQQGDMLLIDNVRMMHGRASIKQPGREILVRMAQALTLTAEDSVPVAEENPAARR